MQVVLAPGARLVAGQLVAGDGPAGAVNVSAMVMPLTVTLPVLVTRKE